MAKLTEIPLETIFGRYATLAEYAGKVVLLVNVASKCGFTPQYAALEALYQRYKERGFAVLGFPANDFGAQEPGSNEEIASFCSLTYAITFPMFAKIVVTGPEKHPLYRELIAAAPQPVTDGEGFRKNIEGFAATHGLAAPSPLPELLWNFEKFLVGRDGSVLTRFGTEITPDDPRITRAIEGALAQ